MSLFRSSVLLEEKEEELMIKSTERIYRGV
jgi:hypothetical protein